MLKPLVRFFAALMTTVLFTVVFSSGVSAQEPPEDLPENLPEPMPGLSPELDGVEAFSSPLVVIEREIAAAMADVAESQRLQVQGKELLLELAVQEDSAVTAVEEADRNLKNLVRREAAALLAFQRAESSVVNVAIVQYVNDGLVVPDDLEFLDETDRLERSTLAAAAFDGVVLDKVRKRDAHVAVQSERVAAEQIKVGSETFLADTRARISETESALASASSSEQEAVRRLEAAENERKRVRPMAEVIGGDFSLVVLDAYWRAAEAMRLFKPECGIQWWALAGIGAIESGHGTFGDAIVLPDGSLTKDVIGIPLDGTNGTASILVNGVPDRAQGPMQFITDTWARYGLDGNGDGTADRQNFYDSVFASANYLCAYGPGLNTDEVLRRAYFGYNHADWYVEKVLLQAHWYRDSGIFDPPTNT